LLSYFEGEYVLQVSEGEVVTKDLESGWYSLGNLLENGYLEDRIGDGSIILNLILKSG
jgi:hypothetical protein